MPKNSHSPFWFPSAGDTYTVPIHGSTNPLTIFSQTGSGVVREIHLAINFGASTLASSLNATLDAYFDGAGSPDWSVPIGTLIGNEPTSLTSGVIVARTFDHDLWESSKAQVNAGPVVSGSCGLVIRAPIPYTNGLVLKIAGASSVFGNITFQNVLPACWNRNLRPFFARTTATTAARTSTAKTFQWTNTTSLLGTATAFDATFIGKEIDGNGTGGTLTDAYVRPVITAVTDATHLTTSTRDAWSVILTATNNTAYRLYSPFNFVSRVAGKRGWLAAVILGVTNVGDGAFQALESNVRLFTDGTTEPTHTWTGTEDFFGSAFYWNDIGGETGGTSAVFQHRYGGITQGLDSATGVVGAYRLFTHQPIRYTNGLTGAWYNDCTSTTTCVGTALVYEETP